MAFNLQSIQSTKQDKPPRVVLYAPDKRGKGTFAASSPDAIFIRTEDGMDKFDVASFPLCETYDDIIKCITTLVKEDHEFKTVVIDTLDWAQTMIYKKVCEVHGVESIEEVLKGYGKGYKESMVYWRKILSGLDYLRNQKDMAVILLCHHEIKTFNSPDIDSYDRYQIKLYKESASLMQEWADAIGFIDIETFVDQEDSGFGNKKGKAITTGRRFIHFAENPAFVAGNRYGITEKIEFPKEGGYQAFINAAFPKSQTKTK